MGKNIEGFPVVGHLQFIRAIHGLGQAIASMKVVGHFERIQVQVWLLTHSHQFPEKNAERPLFNRVKLEKSEYALSSE